MKVPNSMCFLDGALMITVQDCEEAPCYVLKTFYIYCTNIEWDGVHYLFGNMFLLFSQALEARGV